MANGYGVFKMKNDSMHDYSLCHHLKELTKIIKYS